MTGIINLYEAGKNEAFYVVSIPNIGLLESLGLRLGTKVAIQTRYMLGGPVLLCVEDSFLVAIGKDIATQIAVKEVTA
ncbi:MAG: ferrous iron transport protein A [Defluviitaleaceae bacterium]|nr:ferrous iron transport protein A [Defluviitaleaceae bacterium]